MRKHRLIYIFCAISLVSIISCAVAWKRSPRVSCYPQGFVSSSNGEKLYTYPEKIVVKPWRGQHHVYGIFMVPNGSESDRLVTLTVSGNKTYCGILQDVDTTSYQDIHTKPGYSLMKGYLNTRLAVYLIMQGKKDQLKQPNNWKLGYVEKK
ncbi:hypothetical protein [Calothrix sp. PCC 7507]|uniref:hypothetical protein n=1 Tax=Calothrix sp. PCC 7507 TaxID=99598 RepID=UPI00029EFE8F|nr:hypothetical protein [Calothrix sp. PCC 7507]AFY30828.1 hypothetical protein Cal7507_0331 [Calothrix sp. PCC 7507]